MSRKHSFVSPCGGYTGDISVLLYEDDELATNELADHTEALPQIVDLADYRMGLVTPRPGPEREPASGHSINSASK